MWVNAHNTVLAHYSNGTCVSDDAWSKLQQDSRNIWMSLCSSGMGSEEVYVITLVYRTIPIKNSVYSHLDESSH
jgi:hypothetical protein